MYKLVSIGTATAPNLFLDGQNYYDPRPLDLVRWNKRAGDL